jgi:transcriptional regulator with XRE-family HTH domain
VNFDNDEYDEKIRQLRENTKRTPGQIAQIIEMTNEFVYFRLRKMGLPVSRCTKGVSLEGLKAAHQSGMSYADMEREFGISSSSISRLARKLGLPRRKALKRTEGLDDNIIIQKYRGNLWPIKDIAKAYGWKVWNVRERLRDLGVLRTSLDTRRTKMNKRMRDQGVPGCPYVIDRDGYPMIPFPEGHESGRKINFGAKVHLHVLEMEKHLGRPLTKGEIIHHINCNKRDFRIDNLYLCKSLSEHFRIHGTLEKVVGMLFDAGVVSFKPGYGYYLKKKPKEEDLVEVPEPESDSMKLETQDCAK